MVDKTIKLKIANPNYVDETIIRFKEDASENFDAQFDAYKITNGGSAPSLSTALANTNYSINSLPHTLTNKVIPVITAVETSGTYSINADITGFNSFDSVLLEDRLLNVFQNLKTTPSYNADLIKADTATRFFLHYKKEKVNSVVTSNDKYTSTNSPLSIYAFKQSITVNFNDANIAEANVAVFDAIGHKVLELKNANASSGKIEMSLSDSKIGVYIVKVESIWGVKTEKVYIAP